MPSSDPAILRAQSLRRYYRRKAQRRCINCRRKLWPTNTGVRCEVCRGQRAARAKQLHRPKRRDVWGKALKAALEHPPEFRHGSYE